jgi:cytochrome c553
MPAPTVDPHALQVGGTLSALGSSDGRVQACVNCHGPFATGQAPTFPRLAGQYAAYTRLQLDMFRKGYRQNDISAVMREIVGKMTDDEVTDVAAYLETIRPGEEARAH